MGVLILTEQYCLSVSDYISVASQNDESNRQQKVKLILSDDANTGTITEVSILMFSWFFFTSFQTTGNHVRSVFKKAYNHGQFYVSGVTFVWYKVTVYLKLTS